MKPQPESGHVTLRTYVWTYVILLLLATLSWIVAVLHVPGGAPIAIGIGALKALLVLAYFMHLSEEAFSFRLAISIAALMVLVFIGLSVIDPLTRTPYAPAPSTRAGTLPGTGPVHPKPPY